MPLQAGIAPSVIGNNIREMIVSGHPRAQAIAASLSNADRHPRMAFGGIAPWQAPMPQQGMPSGAPTGGVAPGGGAMLGRIALPPVQPGMMPMQTPVAPPPALGPPQMAPGIAPLPRPMGEQMGQPTMAQRGPAMADGGELSWEQSSKLAAHIGNEHGTTGFLHSAVPGRTDLIHAQPPVGSFVVPADVVSGVGAGNSLAGAAILQKAFTVGPYGTALPKAGSGGVGIPKPPPRFTGSFLAPAAKRGGRQRKNEEHVGEPTPILAAGGEFIIHPQAVREVGGGDLTRGHTALDHWVVTKRKEIAGTMMRLPGPKK